MCGSLDMGMYNVRVRYTDCFQAHTGSQDIGSLGDDNAAACVFCKWLWLGACTLCGEQLW